MNTTCLECGEVADLEVGEEFCPECGAYLTERDPYDEEFMSWENYPFPDEEGQ